MFGSMRTAWLLVSLIVVVGGNFKHLTRSVDVPKVTHLSYEHGLLFHCPDLQVVDRTQAKTNVCTL